MRRVAKHDPTAPLTPSGQYAASGKFGVLAERLRLLGDYERESRRVVEGLRREGKKRKEMERLEGVAREKEAGMEKRERTESGNYDRARDPRLRA
ncbi:hypothetical protein MMC19_001929 [Ptychographa xylographoides]|nr:hypothetical protein [Ptychographa xylographoides]